MLGFKKLTDFPGGTLYDILQDAESVGFSLYDRKPNDTESAYTGDYLYYEIVL